MTPMTPQEWAKKFDARRLSPARDSTSFDSSWNGSGANSIQDQFVRGMTADPSFMTRHSLSAEDIKFQDTQYQGDNVIESQTTLSDRAKEALSGYRQTRHIYDGRWVGITRDKDGKVVGITEPGGRVGGDGIDKFANAVIATGLAVGTGGMAGALGGAMGLSSGVTAALSGAARGATGSAVSGGDPIRGMITGGLTAGLQQIPGISNLAAPIKNAIGSAAGTAINGGNLRQVLTNGVMGAAGSGVTSGLNSAGISNPLINGLLRNLAMQRLRTAITPVRR